MSDRDVFEAWLDYPALIKGGRVTANWLPGGRFWFVDGSPEKTTIKVFNPETKEISELFDTAAVRAAFRDHFGREASYSGLPFSAVRPSPSGNFIASIEDADYEIDRETSHLRPLPKPSYVDTWVGGDAVTRLTPQNYDRPGLFPDRAKTPEMMSADGRWFASVQNYDVSIRSAIDGRRERLTHDGEDRHSWDVESVRMGVGAGAQIVYLTTNPWAPDSLHLFATKVDTRGLAPFARVRWNARSDELQQVYISRAGERLPTTEPFVIDIFDRRAVRLNVEIEDRFLLLIGWRPDSRALYFAQFSRDVHWGGVYEADPRTGEVRLLFEERAETFIRIQHDVIGGRAGCTLLPNGQGFIWESYRDGWKHLYHYDLKGQLVRPLTTGNWPTVDVQTVDPASDYLYFTAHHDQSRPYDIHLCRVRLSGGEVSRLTESAGVHEIQMAPDFRSFIATVSSPNLPPRSEVRSASGELLHRFDPADISKLESIGWVGAEEFCVKAADGETDLWGVIVTPPEFDPTKSYPVVECIYGGAQVAYTAHHFPMFPLKMATVNRALPALGYVVVHLDARGTPERSKAFQDATYKEWRRHVTADHAAALRNLAKDRPWLDLNRVGIWGHSWGGYFTFANLIDNPDLYRAGFASAPGFDPYTMFIYEPYLGGVPSAVNKAAYDDANLLSDASKLRGDLMIVAGSNDMGVWQDSVKMTNALIEAGRPHEFVMMPGQHHGYATPHENYFIEKFVAFFDRTVKSAAPRS